VLLRGGSAYREMLATEFRSQEPPGARQIVTLDIDLVVTSCGYGVPCFAYTGERTTLRRWAESKGEAGIAEYWRQKNSLSLDGFPTGICETNDSA
jgi:hypothetical protein